MESLSSSPSYIRLEHENAVHKDFVVVNWCMGNTCNYSCSYCPKDLHDGKIQWPEVDAVKKFIDRVVNHYHGKKIYFEMTGGEVTLWQGLPEILQYLRQRDCKVGIISNGSRSLDFFSRLVDKIDHICLSFHSERANEEHFFAVVDFFSQRIRTHVNFMMKPDLFDKCLGLAMKVKKLPNISLALQPLMKDLNGAMLNYSESQKIVLNSQDELMGKEIIYTKDFEYFRGAMAMVKENGEREVTSPQWFISAGQNSWEGWSCNAGLEQIVVDMYGTIYRGWCLAGGAIGTVFDASLSLPTAPIICPVKKCHCNLDIMSTKVKSVSMRGVVL